MNHIEKIVIQGLKKFECIVVPFREHLNIIVGTNEAGKSTILEAINIVLNQQYRNSDKSVLKDLFNANMVQKFKNNPSVATLPKIYIELQLSISAKEKNAEYFWGENNLSKTEQFGIYFECKFDEVLGEGLDDEINQGKIPYEYYTLKWLSFSGLPYTSIKKPFGYISIDTSNNNTTDSFNYYNRTLFSTKYDDKTRMSVKNSFRDKLQEAFDSIRLSDIDENKKFGINDKKVILESILSVYENSIPLENKGSGMESLIKTKIALDKNSSNLDVILMEEPENHLCYTNMRKMLAEISLKKNNSQIIIATHSNMIASGLNLNNVIWINNNTANLLADVDHNTAEFFEKAENNNFLQLLLSEKVLLVEGATENLLIPMFYKQVTGKNLDEDKISVISCNGISYKNYLEIAKTTGKKVAVITDNDKKQYQIDKAKSFNNENENQHIFLDEDVSNWTWEVCIYNLNEESLKELITVDDNAKYLFYGEDVGSKYLGKMLNNKVDTAYKMLQSGKIFNIPEYVKESIEWLNK